MTRNARDFWTGLIYIFFGSSAILIARDYSLGTGGKMGPAYFPTILGGLLLVIGAISVIRSFIAPGAPIGTFAFKGLALVSVSVACVRFCRARRGIGGCFAVARHHQRFGELTISLASDVDHGGGSHNLLRSRVSQGFGYSAADHRSVVRRLRGQITMELLGHLLLGLQTAATPANLFYCFVGVFLGTAIGVLPGLGPTATIAMLLPVTFVLPPVTALIMLAGIYYGSQYGGSTTSILVNLPGEAASVVTTLDGYQMAKQGRAGAALAASAIGSFFAGTVATFLIAGFGPPLAAVALKFGPAEFFSLMVLGLVASVVLAQGSLLHAIGMVVLGLLLGLIGTDVNSGTQRFTFGIYELADGIGFVTVAMGMFGLGEIIRNLENEEERSVMVTKITGLWPTREDFKRMVAPILRGTIIGSALGILPGSGSILGSFAAYSIEKKVSKNRAQFGKGAIEGVAAPEAANNAGAQTSFIPLLTLGIPSNPVSALMVGAMIIHGIQPGPSVINEQPALFWGMIVSMWIGNLFLVVLNYPLIGMWVRMIMIPYQLLYPGILVFCAIGVFSLKNAEADIYFMALFGVLGYVFTKLGCEPAPMLLAFILGPLMEEYLRRAMLLSRGNPWVFVQRPISATLLALAVLAMCSVLIPAFSKTREEAFVEGSG